MNPNLAIYLHETTDEQDQPGYLVTLYGNGEWNNTFADALFPTIQEANTYIAKVEDADEVYCLLSECEAFFSMDELAKYLADFLTGTLDDVDFETRLRSCAFISIDHQEYESDYLLFKASREKYDQAFENWKHDEWQEVYDYFYALMDGAKECDWITDEDYYEDIFVFKKSNKECELQ